MVERDNYSIVEAFQVLFQPTYRIFIFYGGRAAAKSKNIARVLVARSLSDAPIRIGCSRVVKESIAQSSLTLIRNAISDLGDASEYFPDYHVATRKIRNAQGSELVFTGLNGSNSSIRSMEGLDVLWIEEAQDLTEQIWDNVEPTVRKKGSIIVLSMNTDVPSFIQKKFIKTDHKRSDVYLKYITYLDNPFIHDTETASSILHDKRHNPNRYKRVWLGLDQNDKSAIIKKSFFQAYDSLPPVLRVCTRYDFMLDTASKAEESHDYTVGGLWGYQGRDRAFLLDFFRVREEHPDLDPTIRRFFEKWVAKLGKPFQCFVEDTQSGVSIYQYLRRRSEVGDKIYPALPIKLWRPKMYGVPRAQKNPDFTPKAMRVELCLNTLIKRTVWLPYYSEVLKKRTKDFVTECEEFRNDDSHAHDDQVDMMTMALLRWINIYKGGSLYDRKAGVSIDNDV